MLVVSIRKFSQMALEIEKVKDIWQFSFFSSQLYGIIIHIVVTGASFIVIDGALKDGREPFTMNVLEVSLFSIHFFSFFYGINNAIF